MVDIGTFCIDSTEVTNAQYAVFLADNYPLQSSSGDPQTCIWNDSYEPSSSWPAASGQENHPVVYVDWCDAKAFCKWSGKRLCGRFLGGSNPYTDHANAGESMWYRACSAYGAREYPYGNTFEASTCNGVDFGAGASVEVASLAGCEGGYPGLFDMSGNVWEWEDSCNDLGGGNAEQDDCRLRGGSYWFNGASDLRCANGNGNYRNAKNDIVGFRCCADY